MANLIIVEMGGIGRSGTVYDAEAISGTQAVAIGGTSTQSAAFSIPNGVSHVTLCAGAACHVAFGADPTATTNSIPMSAGEKLDFKVTAGRKVAVIQA